MKKWNNTCAPYPQKAPGLPAGQSGCEETAQGCRRLVSSGILGCGPNGFGQAVYRRRPPAAFNRFSAAPVRRLRGGAAPCLMAALRVRPGENSQFQRKGDGGDGEL